MLFATWDHCDSYVGMLHNAIVDTQLWNFCNATRIMKIISSPCDIRIGGRCFLFHYVSMFYILRYNESFVLHKLTLVVLSYCTNCKNIVARFHLPNTRTSIMAMSDLLISLTQGYNKYLTKGRLSNYNWIKLAII